MNTIHYGTITIEHKNKRIEIHDAVFKSGAVIYNPFKNPFKEPVEIVLNQQPKQKRKYTKKNG